MKPSPWFEFNAVTVDTVSVRIYGEIGFGGVSAGDFLSELDMVGAPNLQVHLNSPGGSVDDGIAIYNGLISHPATVETHVDAAAYSIASVIAQAGNKRVMAPHSRMMVHNAMALGMGYASDFEQIAAHLRETSAMIADIYAEKTGKSTAYWLDKMDAETRFTDKQAVAEGLADQVGRATNLADFKIAANFDWSKFAKNAAEFDAVLAEAEEQQPDMHELIERAVAEGIQRGTAEAIKAIREIVERSPRIDPSDAARRDLESRLAAVEV